MNEGWKSVRLADAAALDRQQAMHAGLPYVGLEDIESGTGRLLGTLEARAVQSSTFRFTFQHVLYGRLRPYLNKVLAPEFDGHCSTEIIPLRPLSGVLRSYLFYWLTAPATVSALDATSTGARMPRANLDAALEIPFPLPDVDEQRRIVAILDEAFEGIATVKAHAEKNLRNAREVFERKLDAVFSGVHPGWVSSTLGSTYDVRDGTHDSPTYHDHGYPLVTSKNLKRQGLTFDDVKMIDATDFRKINERSAVHRGDVLFAMIGTIGNPTVVESEPNFAIKNVALFKVPPLQSSHFLRYYLSSARVVTKMQAEAKGTTQKFVGLGYLRAFPIAVPPLEEQVAVVRDLDDWLAETDRLEGIYSRKLAALDELKQSLLHQAFSGQL